MHGQSIMAKESFSGKIEVSNAQKNLLNIITKQTILSTFSSFSTQTWLIYYAPLVIIWAYGHKSENELYTFHVISEAMMVTDCCVNALCLLLAFTFVKSH